MNEQPATIYKELPLHRVPEINEMIVDIVEGWYADERIDTYSFLDRLEDWLLRDGLCLPDQLDHEVIKAIMKAARKAKRELQE